MQNFEAIRAGYYNLADILMDEAQHACAQGDPDKVHYFVTEARKLSRQVYCIERRFPRA